MVAVNDADTLALFDGKGPRAPETFSGLDTERFGVLVTDDDSFTTFHDASIGIAVLGTEIGQGTDAGEFNIAFAAGADTGTFLDQGAPGFFFSGSDTGTALDTHTKLALTSFDTLRQPALEANGPGQGITGKPVMDLDYGSGAESDPATVKVRDFDTTQDAALQRTDADTATADDEAAFQHTDADTCVGTDTGFPGGRPSDADLFLWTEINFTIGPSPAADTFTGTESNGAVAVPFASADTGSFADAGIALPDVIDADAATAAEASSISATAFDADSLAALDDVPALFVTATVTDTDSAAAAELNIVAPAGPPGATADTAAASEAVTRINVIAQTDSGASAENGFIPTVPREEDKGVFTDASALAVTVTDFDAGSSIEGYAYDIPLFTHWQDAPGTLVAAGIIAPASGTITPMYGVRSASVSLNQSQHTMAGSDTEQGAWNDITDISVEITEGYLPLAVAASLLGIPLSSDQGGNRASLPSLIMRMSQSSPVSIVLRSFSQDHFGNYRTTDIILYAVVFSAFTVTETAYKSGMGVSFSGKAVRTSTDENGAALPPGITPAFGRVQSQPGASYALTLTTSPAIQVNPVDGDNCTSDDEESAGASFRDADAITTAETAAKGVAAAIGPSPDTGHGTDTESVLKGVQFITDADSRPAAAEANAAIHVVIAVSDTGTATDAGSRSTISTQFQLTGFAGGGPGTAIDLSPPAYNGGALAAACSAGGVFTSIDGGTHWQPGVITGTPGPMARAACAQWSLTESTGGTPALYALTGDQGSGGGFLVSLDGGQTWSARSAGPQFAGANATFGGAVTGIYPRATGRRLLAQDAVNGFLYTVTYVGGAKRSADNGATWQAMGFGAGGTSYGRCIILDPSNPNTAYASFRDSTVAFGAWKTVKAQTAATSLGDWTALTGSPLHVEDMAALGGGSAGQPGGMGAAVSGSSYGDSNAYTAGIHLSQIVGRNWGSGPPGVARKYIGNQNYSGTDSGLNPVPTGSADPENILLLTGHGIKVINTFKPAVDLTSTYSPSAAIPGAGGKTFGQERTLLANWLTFYQNKGVTPALLEIILFHECNIHAAIFAQASDYHAYVGFYGQTVVNSGYPLDMCTAVNQPGNCNLFYPTQFNAMFTQIMTDYYLTDFHPNPNNITLTKVFGSQGQTLSWIDFVDSMGKAPGIAEWGFTNGKTQPTYAQMESWIQNQISPVFAPRVAAGKPMGDLCWFDYGNTTHGNLIETAADSPTDPNPMPVSCITLLQNLSDAVTTAQGSGSTVLYAACGPDGIYRSADGGTTWAAINGSGFIDTTQSWWSSIDAWVDPGTGQHQIIAACSNPVIPAGQPHYRSCVQLTASPTGTGAVAHADISAASTLNMTTLPPDGRTWWDQAAGNFANAWPGAAGVANPQIRVAGPAYGDPQYQQLYFSSQGGVFQSPDGGQTWSPLLGTASATLQAASSGNLAADPLSSSHVVASSPELGSAALSDAQAATPANNASTSVQSSFSGLPGLGIAIDAVNSVQYLAVGTTSGSGDVASRTADSAAWATTGLSGTAGFAGQPVLGVYAGRDGSNVAFQLAATQGAGLWRRSGGGAWTQRTTALSVMGSIPAGQAVRFAGSGSLIFGFDRQTGVFRSTDYGVTWTQIWSVTAGNECSGDLVLNLTVANELYVSADPQSGGSGLFKLAGANAGTVGSGITAVQQSPGGTGQAGPLAAKAGGTNGTIYAVMLGGSTATLRATTNSGTSWASAADSSFSQCCSRPRDLAFAGTRLYAALADCLLAWGTPSI